MSRESSPEEGEILEEGEIPPATSTSDRVRPFPGLLPSLPGLAAPHLPRSYHFCSFPPRAKSAGLSECCFCKIRLIGVNHRAGAELARSIRAVCSVATAACSLGCLPSELQTVLHRLTQETGEVSSKGRHSLRHPSTGQQRSSNKANSSHRTGRNTEVRETGWNSEQQKARDRRKQAQLKQDLDASTAITDLGLQTSVADLKELARALDITGAKRCAHLMPHL